MKTKILSKLMLLGFTAVMMVGCGGGKSESEDSHVIQEESDRVTKLAEKDTTEILNSCSVCDDKETHRISRSEFDSLLFYFDRTFVSTNIFTNNGGVIVIEDNSGNKSNKFAKSYPTFKLHLGIETTTQGRRLLVTYEQGSASCIGKQYQGNLGIQSDLGYLTSLFENDISIAKARPGILTSFDIQNHFFSNKTYRLKSDMRKVIQKIDAQNLWGAFKTFDTDRNLYFCEDIMFNLNNTLDEITNVSERNAFQYYFGYDPKMELHKIRLIIVGIDKDNKLTMFDASGEYLYRETSRPRP